jgi:hypothetical protein
MLRSRSVHTTLLYLLLLESPEAAAELHFVQRHSIVRYTALARRKIERKISQWENASADARDTGTPGPGHRRLYRYNLAAVGDRAQLHRQRRRLILMHACYLPSESYLLGDMAPMTD